jgi:hypothetical protein
LYSFKTAKAVYRQAFKTGGKSFHDRWLPKPTARYQAAGEKG